MARTEIKTKATEVRVADFIAAVPGDRRREEAGIVDAIHRRVTGQEPTMWGPSIIGYGRYDYVIKAPCAAPDFPRARRR